MGEGNGQSWFKLDVDVFENPKVEAACERVESVLPALLWIKLLADRRKHNRTGDRLDAKHVDPRHLRSWLRGRWLDVTAADVEAGLDALEAVGLIERHPSVTHASPLKVTLGDVSGHVRFPGFDSWWKTPKSRREDLADRAAHKRQVRAEQRDRNASPKRHPTWVTPSDKSREAESSTAVRTSSSTERSVPKGRGSAREGRVRSASALLEGVLAGLDPKTSRRVAILTKKLTEAGYLDGRHCDVRRVARAADLVEQGLDSKGVDKLVAYSKSKARKPSAYLAGLLNGERWKEVLDR